MFEKPHYFERQERKSFYDLLPSHGSVDYVYSDKDGSYEISIDIDMSRDFLRHDLKNLFSRPTPYDKKAIDHFVDSTKFHIGEIKDPITGTDREDKYQSGEYNLRKHQGRVFKLIQVDPESIFRYRHMKPITNIQSILLPNLAKEINVHPEIKTALMKAEVASNFGHELYHLEHSFARIYSKKLPELPKDTSVIVQPQTKEAITWQVLLSGSLSLFYLVNTVNSLSKGDNLTDPKLLTFISLSVLSGINAYNSYYVSKRVNEYLSDDEEEQARTYARQFSHLLHLVDVKQVK